MAPPAALDTSILVYAYDRMTHPRRPPAMAHEDAARRVRLLLDAADDVLPTTAHTLVRACQATKQQQMQFLDAVAWASLESAGVGTMYSEDAPSPAKVGSVEYINPFAHQG